MVKLQGLYIILKLRGIPAFSTEFVHANLHPDLVSGFLTAISHFAKELNPDKLKDINLIKREDFVIMIEDGNKTFGALIADFDDKDARSILTRVIGLFEEKFDKYLDEFGINTLIFENFKDVVVKEFGSLLVNPFYFPKLIKTGETIPQDSPLDKIIPLIDGEKNINEIAFAATLPIEEVCKAISILESKNFVELKIKIEELDIFSTTDKATEAFSRETKYHRKIIDQFGNIGIDALYAVDGKRDLKEIQKELQIPYNDLLKIIFYLLEEGFITWIELYPIMRQMAPDEIVVLTSDSQEQALAFTLMNICDGTYPLSSISRKLELPRGEIRRFLKRFKTNVRWIEKKI
ncbi:MAG: hypothetical protein LUQ65_02000 [Candidatus Helarchaeota archaeon]|nr:hypothetical protein [Candidatus Helarchaeota archaeon]